MSSKQDVEQSELLPCPFCGDDHVQPAGLSPGSLEDGARYGTVCSRCIAEGPLADTPEAANIAWNTRIATATPSQPMGEATRPLQPAAGFIAVIAKRLQQAHRALLDQDRAAAIAVRVLGEAEESGAPFNHPDFDWSLEAAVELANGEIEHWEQPDD